MNNNKQQQFSKTITNENEKQQLKIEQLNQKYSKLKQNYNWNEIIQDLDNENNYQSLKVDPLIDFEDIDSNF